MSLPGREGIGLSSCEQGTHTHVHIHVYIHIFMYIYIHTARTRYKEISCLCSASKNLSLKILELFLGKNAEEITCSTAAESYGMGR